MKLKFKQVLFIITIALVLCLLTACSSGNEIEAFVSFMILIIIPATAIIAIVVVIITNKKEREATEKAKIEAEEKAKIEVAAKEQRLKEQKEKEKVAREKARIEYEAELQRKRSTKCIICKECSMGEKLCSNCKSRLDILQNKISKTDLLSYEALSKHLKYTKRNVINAESNDDRIYYSTYLLAIANQLNEKYYMETTLKEAYSLLEEYANIEFSKNEEFLKKYEINIETDKEECKLNISDKVTENDKKKDEKKFKCMDGDYVRSKAEREIDNFFFNNRIWHIYEYRYEHPITKEWAIPDFYLPDYNLFIEYFGLNTPEYIENREHKIKMYHSDKSINFEYLTYEDDADLNAKLLQICKKYNIPIK